MNRTKKMFIFANYVWIITIPIFIILPAFLAVIFPVLGSLISIMFPIIIVFTVYGPRILCWVNIGVSIKNYKKTLFSFKKSLTYKAIFVPFYVCIPILIVLLMLLLISPPNINTNQEIHEYDQAFLAYLILFCYAIIIALIILLILHLIAVHLFTSFDNILHLIKIRKETGIFFMIVHILLNLIIFVDVIDSIYLAVHFREKINEKPDNIKLLNNSKELSLC